MILQTKPWINAQEVCKDIEEYINSGGWLTENKKTREFENKLAEILGKKHCILVTSGTVALTLAAQALLPKNATVIVPNLTMIASANAMLSANLNVLFSDIDERNLCVDLSSLNSGDIAVSSALVYVSLNGRSHTLSKVKKFCQDNSLLFIEDACQSFGSKDEEGAYLGCSGDVGCFSLSPHKIITTGQGGFIVTDRDDIAGEIRKLKDFGRRTSGVDQHITFGCNFKFTDLQAVVGLNQVRNIQDRIVKKIEVYDLYFNLLEKNKLVKIKPRVNNEVPWFVDIYTEKRESLCKFLYSKGIGYREMYPMISTQAPYDKLLHIDAGSCVSRWPVCSMVSTQGLWLPSYLELTREQVEEICSEINDWSTYGN